MIRNKDLLNTAVDELPISDELKALLKQMGFVLLKDVLKKKAYELRKQEGFSFEQEIELLKIAEGNGLEGHWREE